MSKRSGFAVKITAFIEADPFDPASLTKALGAISDIDPNLRLAGFVNRDVSYTVRQRVDPMTIDADAEVFLRAAEIIKQRGWCRGRAINDKGAVCLVSAMHQAAGIPIYEQFPEEQGARLLARLKFEHRWEPAWWNDFVCKSRAAVLRRLRTAALKARSSQAAQVRADE